MRPRGFDLCHLRALAVMMGVPLLASCGTDEPENERHVNKQWLSVSGYWKRDTADHHEPHD